MHVSQIVMFWIVGGLLVGFAVQDIRNLSISMEQWAVAIGIVCLLQLIVNQTGWSMLLGSIPGIVFMILGGVWKKGPGVGDGAVFLLLGLSCGILVCLRVVFMAFVMAAMFSLGGLAARRLSRSTEYPFVPFILVAYIGERCL